LSLERRALSHYFNPGERISFLAENNSLDYSCFRPQEREREENQANGKK
jgi:hypothetical protein